MTRAIAAEFTEAGHAEPRQWRDAAALNNADLWLTAEESHRVGQELKAALEPYRQRSRPQARPAGSRRVRVMNLVIPHRPAQPGSATPNPEPAG